MTTQQHLAHRALLLPPFILSMATSSPAQTVQWMRQGGTIGQGQGIAFDAAENAYVVGLVNDPGLFDQDTVACHFADAFIAKYDPAGAVQWVHTGGGTLIDQANDIAVDAAGNAYVTGLFATNGPVPTVEFDGTVIVGQGATDLFVAKYDTDGTLLWLRHGGGAQGDQGRGIALTLDGDVVVSGFFQGTAVFGSDTLVSAGIGDVVLLKYDTNGNQLWTAHAGGPGDEQAGKLTVLDNNDIAVVGKFQQTVTFGGSTITSLGLSNIFLARFDGNGAPLWAVRAGSTVTFASDVAFDIEHDTNGDLVFCGEIAGTSDFGGIAVPTNGSLDAFIARYDGSGTPIWVRHGGGPQTDHAYGLALDADGNSFLTGQADDGATTVFDTITLAPFGNEAVFLAKYDASGAVHYVKRYAPGQGNAVAIPGGGCLTFTGGASGIVGQPAFDAELWQYVDRDIFTARFCEDGTTSVADVSNAEAFKVYPNPTADVLNIAVPEEWVGQGEVLLMDATGRVVRRDRISTPSVQLDLSALGSGTYQLVLRSAWAMKAMHVLVVH